MSVTPPYTIGITGGSASGKTTIARRLALLLAEFRPAVLQQDRYFRDFSRMSPEQREREHTANRPESVNWPVFHEQFERLRRGEPIREPMPDTRPAAQGAPDVTIDPGDVLIVEGLFALWEPRLVASLDLKLFVEVDDDERVLRRLSRDIVERGGTVPGVIAWYRKDVAPNYPRYTAVGRRIAHVIIPNNTACETAMQIVAAGVRAAVRSRL